VAGAGVSLGVVPRLSALTAPLLIGTACAGPAPATPRADSALPDSGSPPPPGAWEPGPVRSCPTPVAAAWTDTSGRLEAGPEPFGRFENGGLSVLPADGGWRFTATMGLEAIKTWAPDGSVQVWDRDIPTAQLALLDLAGDGRPDLVPLAGDLTVQPDWTGAPTEGLELAPLDEDTRYRDASLIDVDGDGQTELLLSLWDGDWGGLELWRRDGEGWAFGERIGAGQGGVGQAFDHLLVDLTGDHVPDIYACNDHGPDFGANRLLANDGAGGFSDATPEGADLSMSCMSASVGDVDGDGALDLFLSGSVRTALLLQRDDGFVDAATAWGVPTPTQDSMGWGTAISDLDNDGLPDLLLARSGFSSSEDGGSVADVRRQATAGVMEAADWGIAPEGGSRNVAALDLNEDGVLDVVWGMLDGPPRIYESAGCTDGAWLQVVAPEGSIVRIEAGDRTWAAVVTGQPGFATSVPVHAHLGLGDTQSIDRVRLDVPWHGQTVLEGPLEPRRVLTWTPEE
jgi:hypothetical protein